MISVYTGFEHDTKKVNSTFKIKISGRDRTGNKFNTLVGCSGLINCIGVELSNKLLYKAFNCSLDKYTYKLRRGLKISFYYF